MKRRTGFRRLILVVGWWTIVGISVFGQATITTDKKDYAPGEWVIITGTGWQGDDSVQLIITHLDPLPVPNHTHLPWYIKPNSDGTIYEKWFVEEQELGTSLKLEARRNQNYAVTYFTDANTTFEISSPNSFTGSNTYCLNQTANNLSAIFNTCHTGNGSSAATLVTVTWYYNTTNSTSTIGATLVLQTPGVSTGTSITRTFNYTPLTTTVSDRYYFVVLSSLTVLHADLQRHFQHRQHKE